MMDREEKVIKGLECHFLIMAPCGKCPYYCKESCTDELAKDALTLLKAQEPRVMTDTELEAIRKAPLILKPNVDAAPVVHGQWVIDTAFGNDVMSNGRMVLCSECGQGRFTGKTNYCPNCGAKMDGERRDES